MEKTKSPAFQCHIKDLQTTLFVLLNGSFLAENETLFAKGVSIDTFETQSGIKIHIAENVKVEKPVQIVSAIDSNGLNLNIKYQIIVEKNASFTLVHCDDSLQKEDSFVVNNVEITLKENAIMHYYKMENKHSLSTLKNEIVVNQSTCSSFYSNIITFNAGNVYNSLHVFLNEPFANAQLNGLYLVDKKQQIKNEVKVFHNAPDCTSRQLYKGIADDEAFAQFNGHIVVQQDAQRTAAFQVNKNIALSDEAHIKTQPFLEIYADDVKCSHGATVGQLDENAMFYLRSRGICKRNARMLLMFAFANEVAQTVEIVALRERLSAMIQQRLKGELHICSQCALHCGENREVNFG